MEKYNLKEDMKLFYVTARSFPQGIGEAFDLLNAKLPKPDGRIFFGISNKFKGEIIYKAAVLETYEGEGKKLGFETFTVKKGEYLTKTIKDWRKHEQVIGETFMKLLADPR